MVEHAIGADDLRVAGELAPVDGQVVAPLEARRHAQRLQNLQHRLGEAVKVDAVWRVVGGDEGEVEVTQIVEYRASARQATDNGDVVGAHVVGVDLRQRVLVAADDDRRGVAPEHEAVFGEVLHDVLFGGQVEIRVSLVTNDAQHAALGSQEGLAPSLPRIG